MILALLLAFAQFSASNTGELRITVTDPAGLPVRAAVEITSDSSRVRERAETNDAGLVTVRRLPFGTYRVVATSTGFAPSAATVEVRSAMPAETRLTLSIAALQASVTVGAADTFLDPHQAAPLQRIGRERIAERPAGTASRALVDLVNAEPGWLLEANGVLHPRGSEYDTQYVVDGLPLTDNRSPAFAPPLGGEGVRSLAILTGGYPAVAAQKIKKGDTVVVLSGKDKGRTGEVIRAMPKDAKVLVSGVNVAVRHRKPSQVNPQGGLERKEAPLHVSKVAIADPKTGKPTRVRFEERDGKKVRVAAKSGELING